MLILTRKRNETIRIGEQIVVHVMRTAKGSVKIGVEAPDSVRIMRGEINDAGDFDHLVLDEPTHDDCTADALVLQH